MKKESTLPPPSVSKPLEPPPLFVPQMTQEQAGELSSRYAADGDEDALAAGQAIHSGDRSRSNLDRIYRWKTNGRGKSRLLRNTDQEIWDALCLAMAARTPRAAIALLRGLTGVDTPVASAIMTAIWPESFTIIDFRALEALGCSVADRSLPFYLSYLSFCLDQAAHWSMTLRQLDRALWQWSYERRRDAIHDDS